MSSNGSEPRFIVKDSTFPIGHHKFTWNSYINNIPIPSTYYILILEINNQIVRKDVVIKRL